MANYCAECLYTLHNSIRKTSTLKYRLVVIILIIKLRNLSDKEVKELAHGHIASNGSNQDGSHKENLTKPKEILTLNILEEQARSIYLL